MYHFGKGGAIVSGTAGKDGELTYFGGGKYASYKFSINAGKKPDGETLWVECNAKFEVGEYAASLGIYKGDRVTVCGTVESWEHNDRTYSALIVEDLKVRHKGAPAQKPAPVLDNFFAVDDDEEPIGLPWETGGAK